MCIHASKGGTVEVCTAQVRASVASGHWASLLPHDQLRKQQAAEAAFVGYCEAPLTFAPTYKYDAGAAAGM